MDYSSVIGLKTVYSAFQGGFTWVGLSSKFNFTPGVLHVRRAALVLDGVCFISDGYDLCSEMIKKANLPPNDDQKREWKGLCKLSLRTFGMGACIGIVSGIALLILQANTRINIQPADLTRILGHSIDFKIQGTVPRIEQIAQGLLILRLITNIVLAELSSDKGYYLFSSLFQAITLRNISQYQWLKAEKPISRLFRHVGGEKPDASILNGEITFEFFIPPNPNGCKEHIDSAVKNIYHYVSTCFENKRLEARWSREKVTSYILSMKAPLFDVCACAAKIFLDRVFGIGADSKVGTVPISVNTHLK